jgi:hypothetical protein
MSRKEATAQKTKSASFAVNEMANRFAGGASKDSVADGVRARKQYARAGDRSFLVASTAGCRSHQPRYSAPS